MEPLAAMSKQRTYWHLEAARRVPTEYEITSSKLLYYDAARGFEVTTPIQDWYRKHALASPLRVSDWERFKDPRETTYTGYVERQKERETYVDGVLRSIEESDYDRRLSPAWLNSLEALLPVLRYPCHGLMMVAAYLGQLAPASRVVIAQLFQSADETRRIQRIAYRMHQLRSVVPSFGDQSRTAWQQSPEWQPLRKVVETLLVTYDFGEAWVALNLVLKPMFDQLFTVELSKLATHSGDPRLGQVLFSLGEDWRWHREMSCELVRVAVEDRADNHTVIQGWLGQWQVQVRAAMAALLPLFGEFGPAVLQTLDTDCQAFWSSMGIEGRRE
jgi:toluene monooxygenase system protein E